VSAVLKGSGRPLPGSLRRTMEESLGSNFSDVRIHTGKAAERSADEVAAQAYTSGNNIVLGRGSDLSSDSGMHTLAHELTHVVQQRQGRDRGTSGTVGKANDPLEHEAEATAHDVMGALRRQSKNCGCGQEH
jgi:Zn-dependent peptidase ImmA (M78 family)